ncbi:unnamed protein product [Calypogeia fissa]
MGALNGSQGTPRPKEDEPEIEDGTGTTDNVGKDNVGKEGNNGGDAAVETAKAENGELTAADEVKLPADEPMVPFLRLFSFADSFDYVLMTLGSLGAIVHGAALPIMFLFLGKLLNGLGGGSSNLVDTVNKYSTYFLVLGVVSMFSSWLEIALWMHTGERQSTKLRTKYLQALLRQDVAYFDTSTNTGEFINSIASDPLMVQDAIGEKVGNMQHYMATCVAGFAVGFSNQWRIALVTIGAMPCIALAGGFYAWSLGNATSKAESIYAEAGGVADQAVFQVRTVYSFVGEAKFVKAYSEALDKTLKYAMKSSLAKGLGMGVTHSCLFAAWALLLWYGGVLIREGKVNGGDAIGVVFAVIIGGMAVGQALPNISFFTRGRVAAYKIFRLIDHEPTINKPDKKAVELDRVGGRLELRNVDFSYPSRPDVPIFKNFSLMIHPGRTVAIVGSSGSGKSTVISLIERFYDPVAGEVLLDDHNLKALDLKWLRAQIGLVNQEPALFATSIAENIVYGKSNATQEEIEESAKAANAHAFISDLPLRYDTQVDERGVQLSGGQKQRVAIARAMLKNPRILLLDEATSALDASSEQIVQAALDGLMVGRTTVVVAHRLSTIRNADTIAVVQDGQIVEIGTHNDLILKESGAYSALVRLQELASSTEGGLSNSRTSKSPRPRYFLPFNCSSLSRDQPGSRDACTSMVAYSGLLSPHSVSNLPIRRQSSVNSSSGAGIGDALRRHSSAYASSVAYIADAIRRHSSVNSSSVASIGNGVILPDEPQEDNGSVKQPKGSLKRLIAMTKRDWKYGIVGIMGSIGAGCLHPSFAVIVAEILQVYYTKNYKKMKRDVSIYSLIFVGLAVASLFVHVIQHYSLGIMGEKLVKRCREKMLAVILRNEMGWFDEDENNSSMIAARLASDATNVRTAIGDRVAIIAQNSTLLVVTYVVAFVSQWKMSLVMAATFPLLISSSFAQHWFLSGFSGDQAKAYARATKVAGEAVASIRTVAAFHAEDKVQDLFTSELKGPIKRSFLRGNIAGFGFGFVQMMMFWSYALGLWYGGQLLKDGEATFGEISRVFFLLVVAAFAVAETLTLTPDLVKGGQAVESVFKVMDRVTAIDPEDPDGEKVEKIKGDVKLKHVTFAYPSRPDVIIFKDLNLSVHSGRSLALVGASGSGKTSVIALIERFYDPISGQVLIDGKDIKRYNLKSVRQHVALVQQEPALFSTTVYENIIYGKEGATEAEVIEAAKAANVHNFISSLPDGYKTQVGDRGVQLSGGQKQRVAIARAVLKDPAILLLDEATSALDAESEKIVQEALDRLMKGRTTVMIAHRLSTIRGADTIAVVQEGTILEEGTHAELLSKGGGYARLINLQNRVQESQSVQTWSHV